ncbi:hypothetical protein AGDE_11417 [Angomonas deanei]|uniref:Tir chaperone protein (CesT) family, putative n=1 Tax=Angomonas deanei TaxID=59799 RepID=A0A7G2C367_9TRYP|nr:hypothetical protein AGDE_11417 [Angomonas deanei]CAD2213955.1 Tir chaperone protein (CesT) family, putative [Angomonas deanei]|eukprot:EPY26345.1 hypothetical protein AGDE_11417 [Angomonas deanei]
MEEKQCFFVESVDGRKFKMVIKGDLGKLSVAKIKRYLKSYGVPDEQTLSHHGRHLTDEMVGSEFDLFNNSVLQLHEPGTTRGTSEPRKAVSAQPQSSRQPTVPPVTGGKAAWGEGSQREDPSSSRRQDTLEQENAELRRRVQQLETQLRQSSSQPRPSSATPADPLENAKQNLALLGKHLGTNLYFDDNLTCVIGADESFTILVTFDPPTERLYVYSTVLTELPTHNTALLQKLQQVCLEGSLLGREVCGGGIGLSLTNQIVVLTTSLPMRVCTELALKDVMPAFVESLTRWRELLQELLE